MYRIHSLGLPVPARNDGLSTWIHWISPSAADSSPGAPRLGMCLCSRLRHSLWASSDASPTRLVTWHHNNPHPSTNPPHSQSQGRWEVKGGRGKHLLMNVMGLAVTKPPQEHGPFSQGHEPLLPIQLQSSQLAAKGTGYPGSPAHTHTHTHTHTYSHQPQACAHMHPCTGRRG